MSPAELQSLVTSGRAANPQSFGQNRTKPRFLPELVIAPFQDGIVIDGGTRLQVLKGKAAHLLLPRLIPLLDGTRSMQQLESAIPSVRPEHIRNAIALLVRHGFVEDATLTETTYDHPSNSETLSFFRRCVGARRLSISPIDEYRNLSTAQVRIVPAGLLPPEWLQILHSSLCSSGMTQAEIIDKPSLKQWNPPVAEGNTKALVISVSFGEEDCEWHAQLDDWCAQHQISWLRTSFGANLDIGPLFNAAISPCYECFRSIHVSPDLNRSAIPGEESHLAGIYFWFGLLAAEIICLTSGFGPTTTGSEFQRYNFPNWDFRSFRSARIPGCRRCRPLNITAAENSPRPDALPTAVAFEDYVGIQSLNLSLQEPLSDFPNPRSVPRQDTKLLYCHELQLRSEMPKLERSVLELLGSEDESGILNSPTLDQLAVVLRIAAGFSTPVTGHTPPHRWTATAGNIGSVRLALAVRAINGLPAGFYFYQPREHSLASFERHLGTLPIEQFTKRLLGRAGNNAPLAVILLLGAYDRLSEKYREFAYRLLNLDAGVALSQIQMVAKGLGIKSVIENRWADDLIQDQLNLAPFAEQSTAVVAFYQNRESEAKDASDCGAKPVSSPGYRGQAANRFGAVTLAELTKTLYIESRVSEAELYARPHKLPDELLSSTDSRSKARTISLPPPASGGRVLGDVLSSRGSVRQFSKESPSLRQLSTMVACAFSGDLRDWPFENHNTPLTFLVLAFRIKDLKPAVYQYDPLQHVFIDRLPLPSPVMAENLFVQNEFASAPAIVWIAGNLAASCAQDGAFGHRKLLLRAGAAANRLGMAAIATGLSGCIVAGLVPGAARQQLGLNGYTKASLVAFAAGSCSVL